jgi:hypothetical protein
MSISRVYKIVNDIDDLVYIGSTIQTISQRMTEHRKRLKRGIERKLYNHMRELGVENFKIICIREYKDISKERLRYKEDKYIKRFDSVKNGLNTFYAFGEKCEHDIKRGRCKECGGSQICVHNIRKEGCKECGGSQICPHGINKCYCRECGGSQICPHGRNKRYCRECGGSAYCIHNKHKKICITCSPAICETCLKVFAGKSNLKKHFKKMHN